jgi:hypothetical protein
VPWPFFSGIFISTCKSTWRRNLGGGGCPPCHCENLGFHTVCTVMRAGLWDFVLCSVVEVDQRFRGMYCIISGRWYMFLKSGSMLYLLFMVPSVWVLCQLKWHRSGRQTHWNANWIEGSYQTQLVIVVFCVLCPFSFTHSSYANFWYSQCVLKDSLICRYVCFLLELAWSQQCSICFTLI